ncbi:MAG: outer membrane protein assembly factor BamD [Candidatus Palauibacterales bacterium]|nr:outer membrane protein assembly factor BamD [Candidatus Palauibacterales bacterium]MDP2529868.1 outer membrane protein assembly factor BamD [Candidatus Palauibacterales bacterium]MDP2584726.1 outer membrane protein assembly factor BamD [Candidatus Palauibacterales bacterium]
MRSQEPAASEDAGEPDARAGAGRRSGLWRRVVPAAVGLVLFAGALACGTASPPKQMAPEGKYRWSRERFAAGDYGAAAKGFKSFLLEAPLDPRADSGQYLLGESYFKEGHFREAADAFDRLGTNRPTSDLADDALLGVCRCDWKLSPELALDQDYTHKAVDACGRLLQYYPDSPLADSARALQQKANDKLADKSYRVGKWYFDHGIYESANVYFEIILKNYPKAPIVPDVLASLYHSYRKIGFDSEAKDVRQRLLTEHADSQAARKLRNETGQGA